MCNFFFIQIKDVDLDLNKPDFLLSDITPQDLGIDTANGVMSVIIERFSSLPVRQTCDYKPRKTGLAYLDIIVYEGNKTMSKDNNTLGKYRIPLPIGYQTVDNAAFTVTFEVSKVTFKFYIYLSFYSY